MRWKQKRKLENALYATLTHISMITSTTHDLNGGAARCTRLCHVATPLLNHYQNDQVVASDYDHTTCRRSR